MSKSKRILDEYFDSSYKICSICSKKKVGCRDAWFQDFTGQKRMCGKCIDKLRNDD